jgi:purine-binding chemotaxis protein CheW
MSRRERGPEGVATTARRREKKEYTGSDTQLVTFTLGAETFGVDVNQVRNIGKLERITAVPRMPRFIEGVMNLRGQITTVIDLRKLFSIPDSARDPAAMRIIVAEIGSRQLGIVVDSVRDVIRVQSGTISAPPSMIASAESQQFLKGVCRLPNQLIMILDFTRLLDKDEMEKVLDLARAEATPGERQIEAVTVGAGAARTGGVNSAANSVVNGAVNGAGNGVVNGAVNSAVNRPIGRTVETRVGPGASATKILDGRVPR